MNNELFGSGLNIGGDQQYAIADEPPPPTSGNKPPADPIRPVPMRAAPAPLSPQILQSVKDQTLPASNPKTLPARHYEDWTPEEAAGLQKHLDSGGRVQDYGPTVGRTPAAAEQFAKRNDLNWTFTGRGLDKPVTQQGFWDDPAKQTRLLQLREDGHSFGEIAKTMGVSRSQVAGKLMRLQAEQMEQMTGKPVQRGQPSLPQFKFQEHSGEVDDDYVRALEKYLKDIHSWVATNSNAV